MWTIGWEKASQQIGYVPTDVLSLIYLFLSFSVALVSFLPAQTLTQPTRLEDGA